MGDATNLQSSFLGGEFSPYAQGRAEDKEYRAGLALCSNGYPIEAGAWTRRQGFRFAATTRLGQLGWLLPFAFSTNSPYQMEFTNLFLRLFSGPNLVSTPDPQVVVSVSGANPAVVTTRTAHGWSNGNQVQFLFNKGASYPLAAALMNRQFIIGSATSTTFTITDPVTGAGLDGSTVTYLVNTAQVVRINEIASPYTTNQLTTINRVQAQSAQNLGVVVTLAPGVAPWTLQQLTAPSASAFATFSYAASAFLDGPYMDPAATGTLTPSGTSGSITLSGAPANTFAATDVGRLVRLFSEPLAWASGTAYTAGNTVKFTDGLYYTAIASSTGKAPNQYPAQWAVNPTGAIWTWATITAFTSGTQVTVTINGAALLYTNAIVTWRLGLYSDTTGYPTNGVYHEGRLWLAGAQGNRLDASNSNDPFNMAPTAPDGTVSDNNAISYVFNAEDVNTIFWMLPDNNGIVCGTQGGEWMIAASSLNDPLTPTSIQAHRRSKYKSANAQAVHAGLSLLFIQAQARKVMEYVADVFSGKFLGRNLMERARHLATTDLKQLAYQQELNPVMWARTGAGQLIGTTYKRESSFTSEPPTFNGWHHHTLGSGRTVESISVGPSVNGDIETLAMISNDPVTNVRHVEFMTDMFDETNVMTDAWFLDDAVTPIAAVENVAATQVSFYGMSYLTGKTVSVWAGGLDLGDYVVAADGSVTVPINGSAPNPNFPGLALFTDTYLNGLAASGEDFGGLGVYMNRSVTVQYPTPSGNTIQSYIPNVVTNTGSGDFSDDYLRNEVWASATGSGTNDGIQVYNRFTGAPLRGINAPSLFGAGVYAPTSNNVGNPMIVGNDGYVYFNSDANNTPVLRKVSRTSLQIAGSFGINGGNDNDSLHMVAMGSACQMNVYGRNYLIHAGSAFQKIGVIDVDNMTWAGHDFTYPEAHAGQMVAGETINNGFGSYANVYSISCPAAGATTPIGFYKTTINAFALLYYNPFSPFGVANTNNNNPGIATNRIAQITPANVDATWTHFQTVEGLVYDQTDGNVIMFAQTFDAVTNQAYVFKVNTVTGAVMWATAIAANALPNGANGMQRSTIKFGTFAFLLGTATPTFAYVNTSNGAITIETHGNLTVGPCISNDIDGSMITFGNWNGTAQPTAATTGAPVSVSFTNQTYRLMGYTGFPGQVTDTQSAVMPVVIGFTYASQGALLRAIAPDAAGTRKGPALGMTRRVHRFAALCANTQGISFGTDVNGQYHAAKFKTRAGKGAALLTVNQLYTGTYSDTVPDDYDLDSALSWQITRPYPATVASVSQSIETQDR